MTEKPAAVHILDDQYDIAMLHKDYIEEVIKENNYNMIVLPVQRNVIKFREYVMKRKYNYNFYFLDLEFRGYGFNGFDLADIIHNTEKKNEYNEIIMLTSHKEAYEAALKQEKKFHSFILKKKPDAVRKDIAIKLKSLSDIYGLQE